MPSQKTKPNTYAATTVALAIALPNLAFASSDASVQHLPSIQTNATAETGFYAKESSSSKRIQPLLNTAKTTQVLTEQTLKEQNLLSLQDALSTTPGISFSAGEAGGTLGDRINLRGYDAKNNISSDGIRDTAIITRTDLFNYDAVEVNKGSNSVENGAGQVSGGVNLVTKTPKNKDFNHVSVGLGTDDYTRFTGDFNKVLQDDIAFRLNVMAHKNTYPGRSEDLKRWGIAPAITFGIGDTAKLTLAYVYQRDNNDPLYGVPYFNGRAVNGLSPSTYYGFKNLDNIRIKNSTGLLKVDSQLAENIQLHSVTRLSDISQSGVTSSPRGVFCSPSGLTPVAKTNANPTGYTSCNQRGLYIPDAQRFGFVNNITAKQFANDTNIRFTFENDRIKNTLVTGVGFSQEESTRLLGGLLYNTNGTRITLPATDLYNPNNYWNGATNFRATESSSGSMNSYYGYIFNNTEFGKHWLLDLGVRFDRTESKYTSHNYSATTQKITATTPSSQNANLLSYSAGLTFKPSEPISIYASYANSQKPTMDAANSPCIATVAGNTCNTKPESAVNYELGMKWEINPNLLFTMAGFRTESNKVRIQGADNSNTVLDGKNYINGVEAGLFGQVTPDWEITATFAWMEGKYKQTTVGNVPDYQKGNRLMLVPVYSGRIWTTYAITDQWQVGYGVTYQGKMYTGSQTAQNNKLPQPESEGYFTHDASITYKVNKNLNLQLIGRNLADKTYYTNLRAGTSQNNNTGFALPGAGRQTVLNINYNF
ncbi:TonB-dependent siderophore receptor [Acinetobacter sp. B10A]|uniref:TonB-dependent receptor n=1 Tax=Acinetobacter baretiae TaxID=2605383 RepID=UPI001B3C62A5|nr:TonB-dependent siderophore receptor [Acinetobacter baretiae]MBF7684474.1 TonB-dependent siderophore receptor [Acinetobacter baretiae]